MYRKKELDIEFDNCKLEHSKQENQYGIILEKHQLIDKIEDIEAEVFAFYSCNESNRLEI